MLKHCYQFIQNIINRRTLLWSAVRSDVQQRYAGSLMGLFWVMISPILLFGIYTALYLFIFRVKPIEMSSHEYVVYIMSGLIPFLSFAESLSTGTTSLVGKKQLLLNTIYPSEFIPLQAVLASHLGMCSGVSLLLIMKASLIGGFNWTLVLLPILIFLQILFVTGIVWFLSMLNLVLRDIQQSLTFITMLIMIISPIAYTPSMVPSALKMVLWLNPFSYFVGAYQDIFYKGMLTNNFMFAAMIAVTVFVMGNLFFAKVKHAFYDYV